MWMDKNSIKGMFKKNSIKVMHLSVPMEYVEMNITGLVQDNFESCCITCMCYNTY